MKQEHTSTVLTSAILSTSFVIGLLASFPLSDVARNFGSASSTEDITMPQKESTDTSCNPIDNIVPVCIKGNRFM